MTKKKTTKAIKSTLTSEQTAFVNAGVKAVKVDTCSACAYFEINGVGANRGRCRRYPTIIPTETKHYCGEYKCQS